MRNVCCTYLSRKHPIFKEYKKIPDYAKGYKNEYLFIRGIDKCFDYYLRKIDKASSGVE